MQHDAIPTPDRRTRPARKPPAAALGRPRIVVAGEYGAGKSSVINAMLRRPFLPYAIGATNRPLISLYHAEDTGIVVTPWHGAPFEVASFEAIPQPAEVQGLAIRTPMPGLQGVEIVELPFHHDGVVGDGVIAMMAEADLLIWVTIASQAWRLTEKSVVERLPAACQSRTVLAVSRADKLRNAGDRDKIEARIRRESSHDFAAVVFMQASETRLKAAATSDQNWARTGGAAVVSCARDTIGADAQISRALPDHARATPLRPRKQPARQPAAVVPFGQRARPAAIHEGPPAAAAPRAAAKARSGKLPIFIRSRSTARALRHAEISSQHVRDAVAGENGRLAPEDVTAEIEQTLAGTSGLDAAGIGNFRQVQVIKSFRSTARISVDANVLASAICLHSAVGVADSLLPGDGIDEVTITVGPRLFLIVPIDLRAGTFAFLAVQGDQVNPSIMRVLLRRIVALWGDIRHP